MPSDRTFHVGPMKTAVVWPTDETAMNGVAAAAREGAITPWLFAPSHAVGLATAFGIKTTDLVPCETPEQAAAKAMSAVRAGRVQAVMKGSLHTDALMAAAVNRETGILCKGRRLSHVLVLDIPVFGRPLVLTDVAVNIAPNAVAMREIIRNAIAVARAIGIERPKVALLSAVETPTPRMPSTMLAHDVVCGASMLGDFEDAHVDGPLALDGALSAAAAKIKGISGPVAGAADILVAPCIEVGNVLYKALEIMCEAIGAGVVVGGQVPIILTSRSDGVATRVASCRLAATLVRHSVREAA